MIDELVMILLFQTTHSTEIQYSNGYMVPY
jgi:hypothetical protein